MKVFLSYAREDGGPFAIRLRDELSSGGFSVWRDIEAVVAPENWREQLRAALGRVDAVVLVLTPGAVGSQYVTLECELALALQKPVIPALCLPCDIPEAFAGAQYRDFSQPLTYAREIVALTRDLKGVEEEHRQKVLSGLSRLREDDSFSRFHQAIERLQRWLNAEAFEVKILSAVVELIRQMNLDSMADGPVHVLISRTIEGTYIRPNWTIYDLFCEQRPIFEFILASLGKDIKEDAADDSLRVPIVLAIMNGTEAQELMRGSAFDGYPEELRSDFEQLEAMLEANGLGDWVERYRDRPEEWRPFATEGGLLSIGQLVGDTLRFLGTEGQVLSPSFIDIRTLGSDKNRYLLRELRSSGCIVVVDSISMRHPAIQRAFQQSLLDAYPKTSVVNIAPIQPAFELVRRMRVFLRLQVSDLEFAKRRLDRFEEYGGCREIHERQELEQWLSDRVRRMFASKAELGTGIRPHMFDLPGGHR